MTNNLNEINSCEVCGNHKLHQVLDLGLHPMCDDLIEVGDQRKCKEYPIEILFCKNCNTAHQRFQVPKEYLFPKNYHYRARFTADVLNGMQTLVKNCSEKYGDLDGKTVLDIGCNDGSLLNFFKEEGALTYGIEPTGASDDAQENGHTVLNEYFTLNSAKAFRDAHGQPDIITFTNVFAHIENLRDVLSALRELVSSDTVIIIENHYLGAVLSGYQFDTFYHEHPRTYSLSSFNAMGSAYDLKLIDVTFPSRYGGNIRVAISHKDNIKNIATSVNLEELLDRESHFFDDFEMLRNNILAWQKNKKEFLEKLIQQHGKLRAKAFPGRAAILVKMLELDENKISAVFEKPGSLKIGNYLPGTRIPIKSDDELFAEPNQTLPILNLAWHIPDEIRKYFINNGYAGEVIDILDKKDFS